MMKGPLKAILILLLLLYLATGLLIPSQFETMTLWYKTGTDRILLKIGQYLGILGLMLLHLQVILSTGGAILERIFGRGRLLKWHRTNGLAVLLLAFAHVICVLVPEGLSNLPIGWKFWPELVGVALLLTLTATVMTSQFQRKLKIPYTTWRAWHKPAGYLIALLVTIHALFVSDSFQQSLPRVFLLISVTGVALWVIAVKWRTANGNNA